MRLSVTTMILCICLCVLGLLRDVSAASELIIYKKVGDEVVLKPDVSGAIPSITWKHGANLAMQWDGPGNEIDAYRTFKVRGKLNNSTGEMTITNLTLQDTGKYTPEINNKIYSSIELIVIVPVTTPTVSESCNEKYTTCTLTCDGNTNGTGEVTYRWKLDDSLSPMPSKTHTITEENSSNIKKFSCVMQNKLSEESSKPINNPLSLGPGPTPSPGPNPTMPAETLKINTGLTVFVSLLTTVVLLGIIHRWKAGMWFFQKASMPWEADFWRKDSERRDPVESNGTTAQSEKRQIDDEETPMREE
ncbi:uncharacterized protein LOC133976413 isoform X1 [Scomber scombrus]|uniref:uncharacterized protein LOC133976413 isoform X1 n=1 Tax=Scomber scombrus TaxID=13677 RepID=UPI002DD89E1C|nr:uncharacterized protein LOC133976413 isoform X1 [Scomber scombrus]